ncbi:MAG: sigma 54-dependent Fis family transcriptional regulator [Sandaracinaceae bacterium]|nr:sigma 54-dependent Fis family transcriptional regulator [Sandaracinaceae bacterium]
MDVLMLCYRGEALREFPLHTAPLEIGRGAGCDIVVHDPAVRDRHYLVAANGGTVLLHELDGRRARPRPIATGEEVPLGRHHSLARLPSVATRPSALHRTDPLEGSRRAARADLSLVIGRGAEARRVSLDGRPLTIGSGDACDVRLADRTVSALHCRFEPSRDGLRVRDLGSRNGTYVDGVVVSLARVDAGSALRVGRTDLRLVARGEPSRPTVIAASEEMRAVFELVDRFAKHPWPVLVTGESGTGKEVIARALHERGPRASGPFVAVNAGGMPASLVESELFGHERGAFTGAANTHRGVFEQAHGGTLFLDEIGELPLELQARLLRVLETWEVRRVGSERSLPVDVRLVCATHRDPRAMVGEGTFREDLYYRIAQLAVRVPPLRSRPRDVSALAQHFLRSCADVVGPKAFEEAALARLVAHGWPGNARELRNAVRSAAARCAGTHVTLEDVAVALEDMGAAAELNDDGLRVVVASHGGNLAAAARALGVPRTTLRDRLRARRS